MASLNSVTLRPISCYIQFPLFFLPIRLPLHHSITCFCLLSALQFFFSSDALSYFWPLSVLVFLFHFTVFIFTFVYFHPLSCFVFIYVAISPVPSYFFAHVIANYAKASASFYFSSITLLYFVPGNHSSRCAFVLLFLLSPSASSSV